jgi:hypothetical protein
MKDEKDMNVLKRVRVLGRGTVETADRRVEREAEVYSTRMPVQTGELSSKGATNFYGKKVYAVRKDYRPRLYSTWADCKVQVKGFSGAQFKSFKRLGEAEAYLRYKV